MSIDLDDLFDDKKPVYENNSGSSELEFNTKSKNMSAAGETSVAKLVDRYKRLMYMVDTSGSEMEPIAPDPNAVLEYEWPEDIKNHIRRVLSFEDNHSPDDEALLDSLDNHTDDEVKQALLLGDPTLFGISVKRSRAQSKMEVIKSAVKNLVDRRYEKFPDAQVILATFDYNCTIKAASHESIKMALDSMYPAGGTNIKNALKAGLDYFEKYPAGIGVNHIVLVTDGEDWAAITVKEDLLQRMKDLGVVLDYIYIKKKVDTDGREDEVAKMFKEICTELGGEYKEVSNASEFEKILITASERLCLPPAMQD